MPRSNRPRGRKPPAHDHDSLHHLVVGLKRSESRRGIEYAVQPVSPRSAIKPYLCPGCNLNIEIGVAHVVVWRTDSVMGERAGLEARRHWHTHCWQIA
ncbi:hypothetical protein D9V32_11395 [Mycetocola tolaasinivorans]|uniref:ATP/GTP-binding protein n=1 Tax=Mycetocola tolaasinivorans TaxID=76635 RepID=A0A3L7A4F2_9MICO|nr:hypothetical protein [Mycetocola tolaasinivorans]RLP75087.1 hypothetical protein D9V32_11395 [Mycetocola tolaasinivorans]